MAWAFVAKTEPSLRTRAMRFLARREHSRAELGKKLKPFAAEGEDVEALMEDLAGKGWLSDARYAEIAVRSGARRYGPVKVTHALRAKGVADEAIALALQKAGSDGTASVERVWGSRFSSAPADDRERGRQVRFLQGRGFRLDDILKFMKGLRT